MLNTTPLKNDEIAKLSCWRHEKLMKIAEIVLTSWKIDENRENHDDVVKMMKIEKIVMTLWKNDENRRIKWSLIDY